MDILKVREYVEDAYNLHIEFIEKIKSIYKIHTKCNQYCLKVINYDYGHFLFIISAIKHLQNKKFRSIPKIIKTKNQKDYIKMENSYAYLCEWIASRQCNYDNTLDILVATSKLAELHKKSCSFQVTEDMNPRIGWLKWIDTFEVRRKEMLDFKRRILEKKFKGDFDILYLKSMDKEVKLAEEAIENLKKTRYVDNMKKEMKSKGFCHHDYANHNILIGNQGEVNIIDFDYCILDTHLHDLASLLIRRMKNGRWNVNNALFIIDTYNAINTVEKDDIPIILAFMKFPQDYWQIGIQCYWENQLWGEDFFIKKLKKTLKDREEKLEFIGEFKNWKYN
ncbi:CotS family spore coat protein [Clostridium sp. WILCCON 0269]|uniref:CotS family spore coat protein n=1 Tax=Candidatus Clostridium eludens TaxID=3381663 RepID=A0ABW8SHW1_9CLOT